MPNDTSTNLDVKTPETPSSDVSIDVKPTVSDSSPAAPKVDNDVKPKTMADAVREAVAPKDPSPEAAKETEKSDKEPFGEIQKLNPTDKVETEKSSEEEKDKENETVGDIDETKPVPYERFKEVNEKFKSLEATIESQKTFIEAHQRIEDFCATNNLTNDDFTNAMELAALLKRDPEAFLEKLHPTIEGIRSLKGEILPEDLQKKVDAGNIELSDAKELAKLRAQTKFGTEKAKFTEQQTAFQGQQKLINDTKNALNAWQQTAQSKDPSYKPKAKADGADGMFEMVNDKWYSLMQQQPPKTAQEAVALAERAYQSVKTTFANLAPKLPVKKALSSSTSTSPTNGKPKSMLDAVNRHLAGVPLER